MSESAEFELPTQEEPLAHAGGGIESNASSSHEGEGLSEGSRSG